jgi:predicted phosphodiesterase
MKHALMADIHGNLEALQTVLDDVKKQGCTHVACLGDIVGYNANPKECLDIMRDMNIPCIKGNHDEYCSNDNPLEGFSPRGAKVIAWTRQQLTSADKKWLSELEYVRQIAGFTIVHATLDGPQRWSCVFEILAATASLACQSTPVCFFGHTHVPVAFIRDNLVRGGTYSKFRVERGRHYLIGVGAVGQPRDGNPKAAYVVYDMNEESIELRRVDYDMGAARKKNKDAGLP